LPDLNLPNHVDNWYDNNGDKDNWLDRRITLGSMKERYLLFGQVINLTGVMVAILGALQDYNVL
jgi:hypothetical protein